MWLSTPVSAPPGQPQGGERQHERRKGKGVRNRFSRLPGASAGPNTYEAPGCQGAQASVDEKTFALVRASLSEVTALQAHLPGVLIPVVKTNHFTILDELRLPNSGLTRAVLQLAGT